ncbi:hypothetical protein PL321_07825 [Caloramator sp. mosi_1]|uniref:hypothetical protein n=1 Tax=Caloramator sp. mosi_1 TaxID=3023090 RepID=UPI00235EB2F0|nr:hypothetical protein [Caloramator sp. mosi_1]WDC85330.1 hypothetical protein PL321_07825 [Caloramator sp. mosi_1]
MKEYTEKQEKDIEDIISESISKSMEDIMYVFVQYMDNANKDIKITIEKILNTYLNEQKLQHKVDLSEIIKQYDEYYTKTVKDFIEMQNKIILSSIEKTIKNSIKNTNDVDYDRVEYLINMYVKENIEMLKCKQKEEFDRNIKSIIDEIKK